MDGTTITWESFTLIYVMAAFTWLGLTVLQAGVESISSWHNQVEALKKKQNELDDRIRNLMESRPPTALNLQTTDFEASVISKPGAPPPPPPPLPPPPTFNTKLVIVSNSNSGQKIKEDQPPVMHNLLQELSKKTKDRPKITGTSYQSPRTLRLSNTNNNSRSFSGGGISLATSIRSSPKASSTTYLGDSLRRRFAQAYPNL